MFTYIYICTYIYAHVYIYKCICVQTHMYKMYLCIDVVVSKIWFFTVIWSSDQIWLLGLKPWTHVYIYVVIFTYILVCIFVEPPRIFYTLVYTCISLCRYVDVHAFFGTVIAIKQPTGIWLRGIYIKQKTYSSQNTCSLPAVFGHWK